MTSAPALLEQWYRDHLCPDALDISSSGVPPITMAELRALTGITPEALDAVRFEDSHSLGSPPLRQAVADAWAGGDAARVLIGQGSNEAVFLLLHTLLEPGDDVVAMSPIYHAYGSALRSAGCRVRHWAVRPEDGADLDLDELERLVLPGTRAVLVNLPHNPSGVTVSPAGQARIVEIAAARGAYLVWDNAFAELVHDGEPLTDVAQLYERAFSVGTLSKCYGLPGLRIGWCVGPPAVLDRTVGLRDTTTLFCSTLTEFLAAHAVRHRKKLSGHFAELVGKGRDVFLHWARSSDAVESFTPPMGGVTSLVRFRGTPDATELCVRLARAGVLLVPGRAFGAPAWARLGYAVPGDELGHGLELVDRAAASAGR
ncbi:aminotransferase [Nonomuraea monospora]|uniref:Aminotransferase n=1 Tax=Nonomuraea monospora TaxID=568818 RepID=A0ABN3CE10_9ACTN